MNENDPGHAETLAKQRFVVLNLIRILGLGMVLAGIAITQLLPQVPSIVGIALALFGLFEFFFLPNLVARNWRSNDE